MGERWTAVVRGCLVAALGMWLCGCGGDDFVPNMGDPDDALPNGVGAPCSTNTAYSCIGRGGCAGTQLCGTDNRLGGCICDPVSPVIDGGPGPLLDGAVQTQDASTIVDTGTGGGGGTSGKSDAGQQPTGHEICDNSQDDDADGDIDCADSDCSARLCAPKAPTGWTGPSLRAVGDDPPDCKGNYPDEVAQGGTVANAGDADCSTCSCEAATVACAGVLDFVTGGEAACGGIVCTSSVTTACTELSCPYLGATSGYLGSALPDNLPACSPSEQSPSLSDAAWGERMVACAPDEALRQGGCAEGEVCAPKTPFDGDICIVKKGDHACPNGAYSKRHVYYTRIDDTRSCSDCACGHDCAYKWQVFDAADTTCASAPTLELTATDQCMAITPSASKIPVRAQITGTGACTPTGGEPTGSVHGDNPITVCCTD